MSMNYRQSRDECEGCGSTFADRVHRAEQNPGDDVPTGLSDCPYCGHAKCCMCDMGDDVECGNCGAED